MQNRAGPGRLIAPLLALALAAILPQPSVAQTTCVEEIAGVCLKYSKRRAFSAGPAEAALIPADRSIIQRALALQGHYSGAIDGVWGAGTRSAIAAWQRARGLAATGGLDRQGLRLVLAPAIDRLSLAQKFDAADAALRSEITGIVCERKTDEGQTFFMHMRPKGELFVRFGGGNLVGTWSLRKGSLCSDLVGKQSCSPLYAEKNLNSIDMNKFVSAAGGDSGFAKACITYSRE